MLTKYEQSKLVVLDKFDDYWGGWKPGQIDRLIHPQVFEASTRVQMIRSGEADISQIPASQVKTLDALANVSVLNAAGWRNQMYLINTQKYPTNNAKFREALMHLWDHDTVLRDIFLGTATRPVAPIPVTMWGHGDYNTGAFDPENALRLLGESGVPKKDWNIRAMYSNSNQEQRDAIELFQANAATIGLQVELEPHQSSKSYMSKARSLETAGHMNSMVWWPAYPTPSDWLYTLFRTQKKTSWNLSYYANPEFDKLVDAAADAEGVNVDDSAAAYIAAQNMLMKDTPAIFYADVNRVYAYSSRLKGIENSNNPAYETLFLYNMRM
jgi:peptide/nickel transport system substrate-binding protein